MPNNNTQRSARDMNGRARICMFQIEDLFIADPDGNITAGHISAEFAAFIQATQEYDLANGYTTLWVPVVLKEHYKDLFNLVISENGKAYNQLKPKIADHISQFAPLIHQIHIVEAKTGFTAQNAVNLQVGLFNSHMKIAKNNITIISKDKPAADINHLQLAFPSRQPIAYKPHSDENYMTFTEMMANHQRQMEKKRANNKRHPATASGTSSHATVAKKLTRSANKAQRVPKVNGRKSAFKPYGSHEQRHRAIAHSIEQLRRIATPNTDIPKPSK